MTSPVIVPTGRNKRTYFPEDSFYDFFDGTLMNTKEEWVVVDAPLEKLPVFIRAGFIVQYQTPNKLTNNLNEMRTLPVELVVGLDLNYRAYGRIYLDDGVCIH
jgi:alpha-glucosidase (family GH31 glycosyl hydrolase)